MDSKQASPATPKAIDEAVRAVKEKAGEFARLSPRSKAGLLRECMPRLVEVAGRWVADGCRAKGLGPLETGEEWLVGPLPTVRMMRLLTESLDEIAAHGRPRLGRGVRRRGDGRLEIEVLPTRLLDRLFYRGLRGYALAEAGLDEDGVRSRQAAFYQRREPEGGLSVILGAGNVSSIPPMDVLTKMFIDGSVCILKMNPVNAWAGPHLEHVFAPLVSRRYLRVVYGGAEVGSYLVEHADVDDLHLTGSNRTHDAIVWGAPGPERDRRMAENRPLLDKPITSELGNVSPVAIVPHAYSDEALWFQARNVVSMVVNNASFNCNAAKVIVTGRGWAQRDRFLDMVAQGLAAVRTRKAYYPGAHERYASLVGERDGVERFGQPGEGELAWAFVRGVDPTNLDEPLFRVEAFCGILSEASIGSNDPVEFLAAATAFMNDRLWGTLNAALVVDPKLEAEPSIADAVDRAILGLRYGTVAINVWPAIAYVVGSLPWGGHPAIDPTDVQSGRGWVHNTYMLDGLDKAVLRGPLVSKRRPVWFYDSRKGGKLGPRLVAVEANPSWRNVLGLALGAL